MSAWAQGEWCRVPGKPVEAGKIIKMWIKRGGDEDVIQGAYEESDCYPKQFIDWVMTEFFADEEDDDDSE
jgi:hypothetical protein